MGTVKLVIIVKNSRADRVRVKRWSKLEKRTISNPFKLDPVAGSYRIFFYVTLGLGAVSERVPLFFFFFLSFFFGSGFGFVRMVSGFS